MIEPTSTKDSLGKKEMNKEELINQICEDIREALTKRLGGYVWEPPTSHKPEELGTGEVNTGVVTKLPDAPYTLLDGTKVPLKFRDFPIVDTPNSEKLTKPKAVYVNGVRYEEGDPEF